MVTKEELARINELAKLAKERELTNEEKEEQQTLRNKYIEGIRQSFQHQIRSLTIIDEAGNDVTPDKLKELKKKDEQ